MKLFPMLPAAALGVVLVTPAANAQVGGDSAFPPLPDIDGPVAPDPADEAAMESLRLLLQAHHALPPREAFEALGVDVEAMLWRVAGHEDEFLLTRQRALIALAWYPSDRLRQYYEHLLANPATHEVTQHQVLGLLLGTFGDRGLTTAERWLEHPDMQRRLTAVHALAGMTSLDATALLERALENEHDALVRERIEAALTLR